MSKLGIVTIGQAPRPDITADLVPILGSAKLNQYGALDGLDSDRLAPLGPQDDDETLVTRLIDGTAVRLAHHKVEPFVAEAIRRSVSDGASVTLLACTGSFNLKLSRDRKVFLAEELLVPTVLTLTGRGNLGVVCPDGAQQAGVRRKWSGGHGDVLTTCADPYTPDAQREVARACVELDDQGADRIVLDCMGYSAQMRAAAKSVCPVPIVGARTLVARLVAEVVS